MKRIIIFFAIFIAVFLVIFSQKETINNKKHIAILFPISHPALNEIKDNFIKTISEKENAIFDVFNGNGDRLLMRSQTEKAFNNNYDLIFAISTTSALICKEISNQRNSNIPVVCGAVSENPIEIGLIKSIKNSGNNFVVVSDHYNFEKQLNSLLNVYNTKRIILPYYPAPGLQKQVNELKVLCKKMNLELIDLKIYSTNELFTKVDAMLSQENEVILVLKDNIIVSGIEALINLSERRNKLLYVSDLNSFEKGATLGFGIRESEVGVLSANIAVEILYGKKLPFQIPSKIADDFKFVINQKKLKQLKEHNV